MDSHEFADNEINAYQHADSSGRRSSASSVGVAPQKRRGSGLVGSTDTRLSKSEIVRAIYEPVQDGMAAVERRLKTELQSPYEVLQPLLRHGTQLGGKRLRPALVLLTATAVGGWSDDHVTIATALEMVHTATLVHDDVLDSATQRRHVETVNARWGNQTSILLGDYLFAQAYSLTATLKTTEASRLIGEASRRVCEGEMRQILSQGNLQLDEPTYLDIIRGKTAELCRVGCRLGARLADARPDVVEAMGRFGDSLGIAFQIADDFLDLWGDAASVGKTLGTDLQQGKMTLPMIYMLRQASPDVRRQLEAVLQGPPEERWYGISLALAESGAREYTKSKAHELVDIALESLQCLPDSPAKDSLEAIARFSIHRRF